MAKAKQEDFRLTLARKGIVRCPKCGGWEISQTHKPIPLDVINLLLRCLECHHKWKEPGETFDNIKTRTIEKQIDKTYITLELDGLVRMYMDGMSFKDGREITDYEYFFDPIKKKIVVKIWTEKKVEEKPDAD